MMQRREANAMFGDIRRDMFDNNYALALMEAESECEAPNECDCPGCLAADEHGTM